MVDVEKLRRYFPATTVYKNQELTATFKAAAIPSFLRDWIIKKKAGIDGRISDMNMLHEYINAIIPKRQDKTAIVDEARQNGESRKFLARIGVRFNVASDEVSFEIPELGIGHSDTIIEDYVWNDIKSEVIKTSEGWGMVRLGYLPPEKPERPRGKLTLLEFKNFCPYKINLSAYKEARKNFTIEEWLDVLLGAIDYNADGYQSIEQKHTMLTRLLPFIEPRVNLVELAPKGTGKSYLFGQVGKYGWLVSGGTLSRARMFYDIAQKQPGLVAHREFVALDEIQSIRFPEADEMQGALKAYMESGEATFGDKRVVGSAGIILLGNIPQSDMRRTVDMFRTLPTIFHESALLDRFHGFIEGRNIPRMGEHLKINGWGLNSEYFCEIMHLMRSQSECMLYRRVVEQLVMHPSNADTRDTEAILRLCTAYTKLLFPHYVSPESVNIDEFSQYCLEPAVRMRSIIREQLQIIDPDEFGGKNVANYVIRK